MYKTLNNSVAEHIVMCAIRGQYRFCAYSLYNHYKANTFTENAFHHLLIAVVNLLGESWSMLDDKTIDYCVRNFIYQYLLKNN